MPRRNRAADLIAERAQALSEARERREAAAQETAAQLAERKFQYDAGRDQIADALAARRDAMERVSKGLSAAKEMYEMNKRGRAESDAANFYKFLSEVDRNAPDAADKISKLKSAFPLATQDEGVRATLANDWSDVLSHRGLSREDRETTDKRAFLMQYAAAAAKDDEYAKNNPAAKQLFDIYSADVLANEQAKRGKAGTLPAPTPVAPTASSFFSNTPKPAPTAAPAAATVPTAAPAASPAPSNQPVVDPSQASGVPQASTPKQEQVSEWASANVRLADAASDRKDLNDMLNESPETQFLAPNKPQPTPTPTPQPTSKEAAV